MKSLFVGPDGDLVINPMNELQMVDGENEVRQRLSLAIQMGKGEWFLDPDRGIPWIEILGLGSSESQPLIESEVRRTLMEDPSVKSITSITQVFDSVNRILSLTIDGVLTSDYGFSLEIPINV